MVRSVRVYRMVLSGDIFAVILPGVTFTLIFITKLDLLDSKIFIINQINIASAAAWNVKRCML
jgi:hypothetical protein